MTEKREGALSAGKSVAALTGLVAGLAFLVVAGLVLYWFELFGEGLLLGVAAVQSTVFAVGVSARMMPGNVEAPAMRHLPAAIVVGFVFLLLTCAGLRAFGQWEDQAVLQGVVIAVSAIVTAQFVRFAGARRN